MLQKLGGAGGGGTAAVAAPASDKQALILAAASACPAGFVSAVWDLPGMCVVLFEMLERDPASVCGATLDTGVSDDFAAVYRTNIGTNLGSQYCGKISGCLTEAH